MIVPRFNVSKLPNHLPWKIGFRRYWSGKLWYLTIGRTDFILDLRYGRDFAAGFLKDMTGKEYKKESRNG